MAPRFEMILEEFREPWVVFEIVLERNGGECAAPGWVRLQGVGAQGVIVHEREQAREDGGSLPGGFPGLGMVVGQGHADVGIGLEATAWGDNPDRGRLVGIVLVELQETKVSAPALRVREEEEEKIGVSGWDGLGARSRVGRDVGWNVQRWTMAR